MPEEAVAGTALGSECSLVGHDPSSGTRSLGVKPAYCTSAVSLVSCVILFQKPINPGCVTVLLPKVIWGKGDVFGFLVIDGVEKWPLPIVTFYKLLADAPTPASVPSWTYWFPK